MQDLESFIADNKRRPRQKSKDATEKTLGSWEQNQLANVKDGDRKHILKTSDVCFQNWMDHVLSEKNKLFYKTISEESVKAYQDFLKNKETEQESPYSAVDVSSSPPKRQKKITRIG